MAEIFPDADLHCLWNDDLGRFGARPVHETWIANSRLRNSKALSLPFMPYTWRRLAARRSYDWMLVSSHLFAHHARFRNQVDVPKFVYVHTPARYIWVPQLDARGQSLPVRAVSHGFKALDVRRAREATEVAANSEFIRSRIADAWGRDAKVIYPPVEVERIQAEKDWKSKLRDQELATFESLPQDFILGASRFVAYKGLDKVIEVGSLLKLPVVLAGAGPQEGYLRALAEEADVPVFFVSRPSTELLYTLYQECALYVFPPIEDFGIMPVEAMAAGARVLANCVGGASESVIEGSTGALSPFLGASDTLQAATTALNGKRDASMSRALFFSRGRFDSEIRSWIVPNQEPATGFLESEVS
ncbi:glycosyltransferase [Arthrobacter nitrophenolicus]|uniref:D-inositol 3-phosphate glycosyltransferase n=2 Tax=Arthrobacter nitrophenolicus TaxID=683150 RepID=A0A4R5XZL4_9MICC|nr:glycosyltransferase [Arthrobacter nitrophenolicus]